MRLAWKRRRRTRRNDPVAAPASFSPPTSLFWAIKLTITMTKAAAGCRSFPGRTYGRIRSGGRGGGEGGGRSGGYKTSPLRYSPLRAPSLLRTCSTQMTPLLFFETPVRLAAAAWARLPISVHILAPDKVDPKLYGDLACP